MRFPQWLCCAVFEKLLDGAPSHCARMLRWSGSPLSLQLFGRVVSMLLKVLRLGALCQHDQSVDEDGEVELSAVGQRLGRLGPMLRELEILQACVEGLSMGLGARWASFLERLPGPLVRLKVLSLS
eukprot:TRINITY_DN19385_c0_g1_i1.p2 TRINITY_DN19385_c0_g1~~TRINITY_DN19385_c0_g1_i1.p2  ORF type:complete len:126 (-),score=24.75 TRINITY_DN19385_c0_g1_i1:93-470(-)